MIIISELELKIMYYIYIYISHNNYIVNVNKFVKTTF